eukprot:2442333-Pleurochrysis_carterae.AAC.1
MPTVDVLEGRGIYCRQPELGEQGAIHGLCGGLGSRHNLRLARGQGDVTVACFLESQDMAARPYKKT